MPLATPSPNSVILSKYTLTPHIQPVLEAVNPPASYLKPPLQALLETYNLAISTGYPYRPSTKKFIDCLTKLSNLRPTNPESIQTQTFASHLWTLESMARRRAHNKESALLGARQAQSAGSRHVKTPSR